MSLLTRSLIGLASAYSEALGTVGGVLAKFSTFTRIPRALRALDLGSRIVAIATVALLALLLAFNFPFFVRPEWFSTLTWTEAGHAVALPRPALYLALLGWALSAAVILAGASRWHLAALVGVGILQLFAIVFVGFAGGKTYWMAGPSWLLPFLAATSPVAAGGKRSRAVVTALLCGLATWHTYLFTPLSAHGRPPRWAWLAALFALSLPLLLRLPRRLPLSAACGLALAVNLSVLLTALRAGETAMAHGLVIPTSFFIGLFSVMWFALGGELVSDAVSVTNAAMSAGFIGTWRRTVPWLAGGLGLAEVVAVPWLLDRLVLSTPAAQTLSWHRGAAFALLLVGLGLALSGRLTSEWTRALMGAWIFSLVALRSYFANLTDLAAWADSRQIKRVALAMFTFAVAMKAIRLLTERSHTAAGARGSQFFVQLGALTFLAAGTQFEFAVDNVAAMKEAASYQFAGATALFLPLVLALVLQEQRWLAVPPRALLLRGFLTGFAAAFVVQLVRIASHGPGGWALSGHLAAVATGDAVKLACIAILVVACRAERPLEASAVAIACALGFAAGYAQDLVVLFVDASVKIVLLVTVSSASASAALSRLVADFVRVRGALPAADHYHLFVVSLLPAAMMGWGIAAALRTRRWMAAALAIAGAFAVSLGFGWMLHTHPLYMTESRQPLPFYEVASDARRLAPLLPPVLGLGLWLYLFVWRPERRAPDAPGPDVTHARSPARRRRVVTAVVAAAVVVGALGAAVAARAPSPLQAYVDPDRRFAIDYPRRWRVERRPRGDTVFYRDDLVGGPLVALHPGLALPEGVSARQLVDALGRDLRAAHPDARIAATASPPQVEGERSVQRIELTATWTAATTRLRSRGTITFVSIGRASGFSYLSYQVPEAEPPAVEALLARVLASYRAADSR
jgi:hypothetical protein